MKFNKVIYRTQINAEYAEFFFFFFRVHLRSSASHLTNDTFLLDADKR